MLVLVQTCLLAFSGLVVFAVLRTGLHKRIRGYGYFFLIIPILFFLPSYTAKIAGTLVTSRNLNGDTYVATLGWASQLYVVVDLTILAWTLAILGNVALRRLPVSFNSSGLAFLCLIIVGLCSRVLVSHTSPKLGAVSLALTFLALSLVKVPREQIVVGVASATLLVCLASCLFLLNQPSRATAACSYKCSVLGFLFQGITPHSNSLAMLTALGLPFVWSSFKGGSRTLIVAYCVIILLMTVSRASIQAAAAGLLVIALHARQSTLQSKGRKISRTARMFLLGLMFLGVALPIWISNASFATGRGYLWTIGMSLFERSPYIGLGVGAWGDLAGKGLFSHASEYASHNQWLEAMIVGGIFGLIALGFCVARAIFVRDPSLARIVHPLLATILTLGTVERPVPIDQNTSTIWVMYALIALMSSDLHGAERVRSRQSNRLVQGPTSLWQANRRKTTIRRV